MGEKWAPQVESDRPTKGESWTLLVSSGSGCGAGKVRTVAVQPPCFHPQERTLCMVVTVVAAALVTAVAAVVMGRWVGERNVVHTVAIFFTSFLSFLYFLPLFLSFMFLPLFPSFVGR
jgi:hypothetical protein